jgi:D-glycerate 3-kinase
MHPLLATRGPPGTHDIALACETLDALREGRPVRLPRFDKLRDRRLPPSRWPLASAVDLTIFEGWCLKLPPQSAQALRRPINSLERDEDADGIWRRSATPHSNATTPRSGRGCHGCSGYRLPGSTQCRTGVGSKNARPRRAVSPRA